MGAIVIDGHPPLATHIEIVQGDCLHVLQGIADDSVDMIVTSPPYADQRKHTYGGVAPGEYVDQVRIELATPQSSSTSGRAASRW